MLRVSVVSPPETTEQLADYLVADPGVINLVVRSGARRPQGDSVQFDLMNAYANPVLSRLRDLGLEDYGSVILEEVDAALVDRPERSRWRPTRHGDMAPVWALTEERIRADAAYSPSFFALLAFAGLIGACGILTNSQILIVGAMVIGPEYSAIVAVALGLETRDWRAVARGLQALLAGFVFAIVVTLIFAACIRGAGQAPQLFLAGIRPVSDLINAPNIYSVVVAVVAGMVGIVSLTLAKVGALVGVFISITTIPAAADAAVSAAFGSWSECVGSIEQLILNVGLLIIVGALAIRAQRALWRSWKPPSPPGSPG
jgi:uncharacterized hydrophobic protein (TIGR00271 family)